MLSRSLLLSTCCLAFIATPALPQSNQSQQRTSRSVLQQPAVQAPTLRAALRLWGLDRQSTRLRFTKRDLTSDTADFSTIVSTGEDGKVVTLENLVIRRNAAPGPNFGQFTIEGTKMVGPDGLTMGGFSLVGLRGGDNLAGLVSKFGSAVASGAESKSLQMAPSTNPISIARFTMTDLVTQSGGTAKSTRVSIGEISLNDIVLAENVRQFEGLSIKDLAYGDNESEFKLGSLVISGVGPTLMAFLQRPQNGARTPMDISQLTLGGLALSDLSMTFRSIGGSRSPIDSLGLQALSIGEVKQGFMEHFRFSGVKFDGMAGRQPWQMTLARIGVTGLNLGYISEVSRYFRATIKAALASPNAPSAPSVSASPGRALKDMLPGGPLDSGFTGFDLAELKVSGGGLEFDIDQIGFKQERNPQGIVTRADFTPTQMRLAWPQSPGSRPNPVTAMLSGINAHEIMARFSVSSSFEPGTDRLNLESYRFEIVDWGSFNLGFTLSGMDAFMAKTSFSDLLKYAAPPVTRSNKSSRSALTDMLGLYRDISITTGQIEITDSGGLNKAARLVGSQGRRIVSGTSANLTIDQIRNRRIEWAQKPRATAGDKSKPAVLRFFSIAVARWLEGGGSMKIAIAPPRPIGVAEFNEPNELSVERLGLKITNQPAS
jgi:hypothetical protein